jgi:hypothetical protein
MVLIAVCVKPAKPSLSLAEFPRNFVVSPVSCGASGGADRIKQYNSGYRADIIASFKAYVKDSSQMI